LEIRLFFSQSSFYFSPFFLSLFSEYLHTYVTDRPTHLFVCVYMSMCVCVCVFIISAFAGSVEWARWLAGSTWSSCVLNAWIGSLDLFYLTTLWLPCSQVLTTQKFPPGCRRRKGMASLDKRGSPYPSLFKGDEAWGFSKNTGHEREARSPWLFAPSPLSRSCSLKASMKNISCLANSISFSGSYNWRNQPPWLDWPAFSNMYMLH
jgi:hypothetical protein